MSPRRFAKPFSASASAELGFFDRSAQIKVSPQPLVLCWKLASGKCESHGVEKQLAVFLGDAVLLQRGLDWLKIAPNFQGCLYPSSRCVHGLAFGFAVDWHVDHKVALVLLPDGRRQ